MYDDPDSVPDDGHHYNIENIRGIGHEFVEKLRKNGYATLEDIGDAEPSELARKCGIDEKTAERTVRRARASLEFENKEKETAWKTLLDESVRQHTLSAETMNSTMQRVGFLLAFAPILLIEAVKCMPEGASFSYFAPVIFLGLCFTLGMVAILNWKMSTPSFGADIEEMYDHYEENNWEEVQNYALNSAIDGYEVIRDRAGRLRSLTVAMAITLILGVFTLIPAMLKEWGLVEIFLYVGMAVLAGLLIKTYISERNDSAGEDNVLEEE